MANQSNRVGRRSAAAHLGRSQEEKRVRGRVLFRGFSTGLLKNIRASFLS